MNTKIILKRGHLSFLRQIETIPGTLVDKKGACGEWTVKDIIAHICSYERLLTEVLQSTLDKGKTVPSLVVMGNDHEAFNSLEVKNRKQKSLSSIVSEYKRHYKRVMLLTGNISSSTMRKAGTIPWYHKDYSLEDFITVLSYGHKKEHGAQIAVLKSRKQ